MIYVLYLRGHFRKSEKFSSHRRQFSSACIFSNANTSRFLKSGPCVAEHTTKDRSFWPPATSSNTGFVQGTSSWCNAVKVFQAVLNGFRNLCLGFAIHSRGVAGKIDLCFFSLCCIYSWNSLWFCWAKYCWTFCFCFSLCVALPSLNCLVLPSGWSLAFICFCPDKFPPLISYSASRRYVCPNFLEIHFLRGLQVIKSYQL